MHEPRNTAHHVLVYSGRNCTIPTKLITFLPSFMWQVPEASFTGPSLSDAHGLSGCGPREASTARLHSPENHSTNQTRCKWSPYYALSVHCPPCPLHLTLSSMSSPSHPVLHILPPSMSSIPTAGRSQGCQTWPNHAIQKRYVIMPDEA